MEKEKEVGDPAVIEKEMGGGGWVGRRRQIAVAAALTSGEKFSGEEGEMDAHRTGRHEDAAP